MEENLNINNSKKELEVDWSMIVTDTWLDSGGIEYCIGNDEHDAQLYFAGTITTFGEDKQVFRFKYNEKPERSTVEKDCAEYIKMFI